jgi:hypothetical protein
MGGVLAGLLVAAAAGTALTACSAGGRPAAAATPATRPVLPRATCGKAVTHGLSGRTQVLSADKGALTCFAAAVRHCASASIAITEMGVDTGTNRVFAVGHGTTPCRVTELSQYYSANGGGTNGPVTTASCRPASVTGAGVMLRCGTQDLLVPASVTRL